MEDRRSRRFMSSSMPFDFSVGGIEHHGVAQRVDQIDAVRIDCARTRRQQRQQRFICWACANGDQIRMRRLQFLQVAAIAVADKHPLHAIHFAIEREAHLARVIQMPAAFIVAAAVLHVQKVHLPLRNCGLVSRARRGSAGAAASGRCQRGSGRGGFDQLSGIDAAARMPISPVVQIEGESRAAQRTSAPRPINMRR